MSALRENLLAGRTIAVAGSLPATAADALTARGAQLRRFEPGLDDEGAEAWARAHGPLHALAYDARGAFAAGGGADALRDALEHAWIASRAVANGALIPEQAGGKLILVAPAPDAGDHAEPARSGLENLARTLSVEWARYRITAVAIAPGPGCSDEELGELLCFLCSPAGDYYSGCRLALGSDSAPRSS